MEPPRAELAGRAAGAPPLSSGEYPGPNGSDPFADRPPDALTLDQAEAIRQWLQQVAPMIGLHGWRFYVSTREAQADASASSSVRVDSDEAWIAVEAGHFGVAERVRRQVLTHELMHCHVQPFVQPIVDLLEERLAAPTWELARALLRSPEERMIDRLAWAISEYLPPCPDL